MFYSVLSATGDYIVRISCMPRVVGIIRVSIKAGMRNGMEYGTEYGTEYGITNLVTKRKLLMVLCIFFSVV